MASAAADRWRIPGEWEPQAAMVLAWPTEEAGWPAAHLDQVVAEYVGLIEAIQATTPVVLCLSPGPSTANVRKHFATANRPPSVIRLAYRDCWVRDFGPLVRVRNGKPGWLNFRFHNWDGAFAGAENDAFTHSLAKQLKLGARDIVHHDWALEGGAIESDGAGTLLIRSSYFEQQYPDRSLAELEAKLLQALPAGRILWLKRGALPGDQTGGHVDLLARFASRTGVVYQGCQDATHPAWPELSAMAAELAQLRQTDGSPYVLHELPLPSLTRGEFGEPLPLSYANYVVSNGQVLVPVFGCDTDQTALDVISRAFPQHRVRGTNCRNLIDYGGGLHCATLNLWTLPSQTDAE